MHQLFGLCLYTFAFACCMNGDASACVCVMVSFLRVHKCRHAGPCVHVLYLFIYICQIRLRNSMFYSFIRTYNLCYFEDCGYDEWTNEMNERIVRTQRRYRRDTECYVRGGFGIVVGIVVVAAVRAEGIPLHNTIYSYEWMACTNMYFSSLLLGECFFISLFCRFCL